MANKAPVCKDCDYCSHYAKSSCYTRHEWCHHPIWRIFKSNGGARWIPAREKGKTSPQWCPLRKEKEARP